MYVFVVCVLCLCCTSLWYVLCACVVRVCSTAAKNYCSVDGVFLQCVQLVIYVEISLNRTALGPKTRFGLERFYMYSKYKEQDLKTHIV